MDRRWLVTACLAGAGVWVWSGAAARAAEAAPKPPAAQVQFRKVVLDRAFRSEGVAVGDVNRDGKMDVLAGEMWYEGPDWRPHEIIEPGKYDPKRYSQCFIQFAYDVNGDGWVDTICVGYPGRQSAWCANPGKKGGHWARHLICEKTGNESPQFVDLLGSGKPVLVYATGGRMGWSAIPQDPAGPWEHHPISEKGAPGTRGTSHGLGAGDVNGDGRLDILVAGGWWEAPENRTKAAWAFHPAKLGGKCADMHAYDVDGDGDNDVISSSAHNYGVWWFEQVRTDQGVGFKQHEIHKGCSQTHALQLADLNGDGLKDLVTGKRYFAHGGRDPGAKEPALLLWLELRRPGKGKVEYVYHPIDDDSGVGTQFQMADVNGDGRLDIVTSNKKGVHVFLRTPAGAELPKPAAKPGEVDFERIPAEPLFDGKSFAGWEGNLKWFRVQDGAIVAGTLKQRIPHNEFLCTQKRYGDFELRLKCKLIGRGANAGIQFRTEHIPNHHEVRGYQADMDTGRGWWGALYDESRRNRMLTSTDKKAIAKVLKPDDWNEYVIRCVGPRIQMWLNGLRTVDYTEPDAKIPRTGIIGLQVHGGPPSEAWYKDITIKVPSLRL